MNSSLPSFVIIFLLFVFDQSCSQTFDEHDFYYQRTENVISSETEISSERNDDVDHSLKDSKHGVKMGVSNSDCDDGKANLEVDWDESPINYTCYTPKERLLIDKNQPPALECEDISTDYVPQHYCMSTKIEYDTPLPTHAGHRPLWAMFGEYKFLPPQRWSHNIEHGSVVMLYHPCAHPHEVDKLRKIVTGCIRKHVISPYNLVPEDYPLVLMTWGCRLKMSQVDEKVVKHYIKEHALHGPEGHLSKEGQYTHLLLTKASIPEGSTFDDDVLCP
uniref:DUF3105 domain containing protein n=1 Tax=Hemiscolopendra marginata TaxID=943146 RepID=A0A646QJ62_9MYRI